MLQRMKLLFKKYAVLQVLAARDFCRIAFVAHGLYMTYIAVGNFSFIKANFFVFIFEMPSFLGFTVARKLFLGTSKGCSYHWGDQRCTDLVMNRFKLYSNS